MEPRYIVIGIAILIVVFFGIVIRGSIRKTPGSRHPHGNTTDEDIRRLARDGQRIEAIKSYRELHRVGLKDAKEAVERMEQSAPEPSQPPATSATDDDIRRLIREDRTIEAIKCYRELHRVGLKEAKEAVERMQSAGI